MFQNHMLKATLKSALLLSVVASVLFISVADAAELINRSVSITNARPGEVSDQLYSFEFTGAINVGSIAFEYCGNTASLEAVCVPPSGLNVGGASLVFQSGEVGFGVHPNTNSNRIVISRPAVVVTPGIAQYLFSNVINQSTVNDTAYVRIFTYASTDGTGGYLDAASVAYSTSQSITASAYVPPHLIFCVGITVELDCSNASGNFIQLGELEPTLSAVATSQYSGATNDPTGYTVSIVGTTMTSGNNAIPALGAPSPSVVGQSQFGVNLRDNTSPDVGSESVGPGTAVPTVNYAQANAFVFNSGDILSSVASTTSYDRFTVSYLVNVSNVQPPGVYNATLSYIATASF